MPPARWTTNPPRRRRAWGSPVDGKGPERSVTVRDIAGDPIDLDERRAERKTHIHAAERQGPVDTRDGEILAGFGGGRQQGNEVKVGLHRMRLSQRREEIQIGDGEMAAAFDLLGRPADIAFKIGRAFGMAEGGQERRQGFRLKLADREIQMGRGNMGRADPAGHRVRECQIAQRRISFRRWRRWFPARRRRRARWCRCPAWD